MAIRASFSNLVVEGNVEGGIFSNNIVIGNQVIGGGNHVSPNRGAVNRWRQVATTFGIPPRPSHSREPVEEIAPQTDAETFQDAEPSDVSSGDGNYETESYNEYSSADVQFYENTLQEFTVRTSMGTESRSQYSPTEAEDDPKVTVVITGNQFKGNVGNVGCNNFVSRKIQRSSRLNSNIYFSVG